MIALVFDQMKWLAGLFNSGKVNGFGVCRGLMTIDFEPRIGLYTIQMDEVVDSKISSRKKNHFDFVRGTNFCTAQ
jgi:hypothetical protein